MARLVPAALLPEARAAAAWAIACGALVSALIVAAKSLRDALLCADFGPSALPAVLFGGALASGLLALGGARVFRRRGPVFGVVALLAVNAVLLSIEYRLAARAPRAIAMLLYFQVSAVAAVLSSGFWLVISERFDPHSLRLLVARIGLGGSLGGLGGGALVTAVARTTGPRYGLLLLAALSVALALMIRQLASGVSVARTAAPSTSSVARSSYVRTIALLIGLTALAASLADFAFKLRALEHFASAASLVWFFSVFYGAVNLAGFVIQSTLTPRLLEKTDLGVALAGLPVTVGLTGLVALIIPGLPAQALLKAADGALDESLFRSAYEPLFTPLPAPAKRSVKTLIDVVIDKAGDLSGSALAWALVALVPSFAAAGASFGTVVTSIVTLFVIRGLYKSYVEELAASLRAGSIVLDQGDVYDRTTRLTLSKTLDHMSREQLLEAIQRRVSERPQLLPSDPARPTPVPPAPRAGNEHPAHAEPNSVAELIPLLERADVAESAMTALGKLGTRISGQLTDALLDTEHHAPTLRRRLARIIAQGSNAWAAAGLLAALDDPDYTVRAEVLRGLDRMRRDGIVLPATRETLLRAALGELQRGDLLPHQSAVDHALLLLGLSFEPEPFRLARKAVVSPDPKLRGTALEYLENVVPEPVRSVLLRALSPSAPRPKSSRVVPELLAELQRGAHP